MRGGGERSDEAPGCRKPFAWERTNDPERGRLTVVGATWSTDYPTTTTAFQALYGLGRPGQIPVAGTVSDAVRTEFDMLPAGVGRTDGTGSKWGPVPAPLPGGGATGATTPALALAPFGRRVGEPAPLRRILVEFEGENAPGATPAVVFSRPSTAAWVLGTVLQFGFPSSAPIVVDAVECWLLDQTAVMFVDPWFGNVGPWRFLFTNPLAPNPMPPHQSEISAQLFRLITCYPSQWVGSTCAFEPTFQTDMAIVASPALFFQF
jgi:hypothetical protein